MAIYNLIQSLSQKLFYNIFFKLTSKLNITSNLFCSDKTSRTRPDNKIHGRKNFIV